MLQGYDDDGGDVDDDYDDDVDGGDGVDDDDSKLNQHITGLADESPGWCQSSI